MINSATKKDITWGYMSQFLNVGAGIILIPAAIKYLSAEEMGLWYVFIALASLAQLLEFGFQPTISRLTSYVYSGAESLKAQGLPELTENGLNKQLLVDLIAASRNVYRYIAFMSAFVLLIGGSGYIYSLGISDSEKYIAWAIFSISSIVNFYFTYFNGLLQGRGEQTVLNKTIAQSKVVLIMITFPMLVLNFGLLSISIGTFVSMVFNRYLIYVRFYDIKRAETTFIFNTEVENDLSSLLLASSWRLGVTQVGTFLILRGNLLIASSFLGLKVAASYGLALQLINLISMVSRMVMTLNVPKMNALQSKGKKSELRQIFSRSLLMAIMLFVVGMFSLVFIGGPVLNLISRETTLVSMSILILLGVFQLLEMNHSMCAAYLTTLNYVPFVKSALVSGFMIILLGVAVVNVTNYGLIALIISQGLVQLTFNNWYWPFVAYSHLKKG